jgi:hypothetical protein
MHTTNKHRSEWRIFAPAPVRKPGLIIIPLVITVVMLQFGTQRSSAQLAAESVGRSTAQLDTVSKYEDSWTQCEVETCDWVRPGWYCSGEVLAWRMRRQGLDYAIPVDGTAEVVGAGTVEDVEFSRDGGYRLGLGYVTRTGWDIGFRYTRFDTDQTASAAQPLQGTLWATRSLPARNQEAETAIANAGLDYQTFDLEFGRWIGVTECSAFRVIGGLRWLDADQQMVIQYDGNDFVNGIVFDQKSDQAFGIRAGAEGHLNLIGGWSGFVRGVGSVAFTRSNSKLLETNISGSELIVEISDRFTEPVSNFEAAIGLSWNVGSWSVSGGYEMTHWLNLSRRTTFNGLAASNYPGVYNHVAHDVVLEGMFFRAAYSH